MNTVTEFLMRLVPYIVPIIPAVLPFIFGCLGWYDWRKREPAFVFTAMATFLSCLLAVCYYFGPR